MIFLFCLLRIMTAVYRL